jgi:TonB family protein
MTHLGPSLRRAKVREHPGRRVTVAILASILANLAILAALAHAGAFQLSTKDVKPVTLAPISSDRWAANRAIAGAPPERKQPAPFAMPRPPAQPPAPVPEKPKDEKGQVVDLGPTNGQKPKDSRFLSEQDSSVDKETRSRHARRDYERALPTPSTPGPKAAPPPGQNGKGERSAPGLEGPVAGTRAPEEQRKVAAAPPPDGGELPGGPAPREGIAPAPAPTPGVSGEGGEQRAGAPGENKLIAPGTLARIAGGPAPDHLDGVEEGEGTFLNAKGWKYATYFNRIKQAVASAWDPMTPLEARDPDRSMFGYKDRFTLLGVTLDDTGRLKTLVVEQTSGVEFLDRAAMTAFRTAQPFMNPPRGIVDDHGEIKFSFGFFLEVGRAGLRIYRAPQ